MKKLLLITAASLFLIASTSILAKNAKVTVCPSVSTIQSVKLDLVAVNGPKWVAGIERNTFGTNMNWSFLIFDITTNDSSQVLKIGTEALKSLKFVSGPPTHEDGEPANCKYTTDEGYEAEAMSPPGWT